MVNQVVGTELHSINTQKSKFSQGNIVYRGKTTNALEKTPTNDEFQKKGIGKGAKIALWTLGLAGVAVAIDRIFLKGKYTDDILKHLKKNTDEVKTQEDQIRLLTYEPKNTEKANDIVQVVEEATVEKPKVFSPDKIEKPQDSGSSSLVEVIEKSRNEVKPFQEARVVDEVEDVIVTTVKEADGVVEVKPINNADDLINKTIKELDNAEEQVKKQRKEARRIEQDNLNIAAAAIFADDALRQGKNKIDDVVDVVKDKADDVVEDLSSGFNRNTDDVVMDAYPQGRLDDVADDISPVSYEPIKTDCPSLYEHGDISYTSWNHADPMHSSPLDADDLYNPSLNPIGGDDLYNPSYGTENFGSDIDLLGGGDLDLF